MVKRVALSYQARGFPFLPSQLRPRPGWGQGGVGEAGAPRHLWASSVRGQLAQRGWGGPGTLGSQSPAVPPFPPPPTYPGWRARGLACSAVCRHHGRILPGPRPRAPTRALPAAVGMGRPRDRAEPQPRRPPPPPRGRPRRDLRHSAARGREPERRMEQERNLPM